MGWRKRGFFGECKLDRPRVSLTPPCNQAQELDAWQKLFYLAVCRRRRISWKKQAGWLAWAMMNDLPRFRFGCPNGWRVRWIAQAG